MELKKIMAVCGFMVCSFSLCAQDMAEYSSSIPQTGKADTQSLDVYFTQRHDMEKIGEISDSLNQQNAQTLEMSKKETAKDIMREVVLQKGKEGY